jgi:hypothetical protein
MKVVIFFLIFVNWMRILDAWIPDNWEFTALETDLLFFIFITCFRYINVMHRGRGGWKLS